MSPPIRRRGMITHKARVVPIAGALAASSLLALAGCGVHPAPARTHSAPAPAPVSGSSDVSQPALLVSGSQPPSTSSVGGGSITTTGTATVSGAPDTMTVTVRISTSGAHAAATLARNNAITLAVQQSLERDGVGRNDIQTTGLSLQESYPPSPAGFEVDDEVSATLHNLTRAGTAIDDAVSTAGDAGRLDGVTFSMSDTSPLMGAARRQAVALARADAEQLAAAAGERVVGLQSVTDQTDQNPQPISSEVVPAAGSASGAAVPVQPGTQQLIVAVSAVWDVSR